MPQYLSEEDLWDIDPERLEKCREKLPDSNFDKTDGIVLRNSVSAVWWALTGRGTGLRYSIKLHPEGKQYLVVAPGGHTILGSKLEIT